MVRVDVESGVAMPGLGDPRLQFRVHDGMLLIEDCHDPLGRPIDVLLGVGHEPVCLEVPFHRVFPAVYRSHCPGSGCSVSRSTYDTALEDVARAT